MFEIEIFSAVARSLLAEITNMQELQLLFREQGLSIFSLPSNAILTHITVEISAGSMSFFFQIP